MKKVSFIGAGNMGKAMIGGVIDSGVISPENIMVSDLCVSGLKTIKEDLMVNITTDSKEAVEFADIVIFAVKPNIINGVMESVKDLLGNDKISVSIAAAVSLSDIEDVIGSDKKIVRVMPNTPALVGEAMSGICKNKNVSEEDIEIVQDIFNSFGKSEIVSEDLMDVVTGVSGSSPAYVFMFIEAMADAAVLNGMTREKAYRFASQAVYGAAKMVLETGKHPGELKDMVCSPGGTTIKAVEILEENGMRNAVIKGLNACVEKSINMGKIK